MSLFSAVLLMRKTSVQMLMNQLPTKIGSQITAKKDKNTTNVLRNCNEDLMVWKPQTCELEQRKNTAKQAQKTGK